jgi:ABC-2 type transport system permease protein
MNLRIVSMDVAFNLKSWWRSRGTVFWSLLFPVMLILIFGAIFSGTGATGYPLYVQDFDHSTASSQFLGVLNNTSMMKITILDDSVNATKYIKDHNIQCFLVIPDGFQQHIMQSMVNPNSTMNLTYYFDPSQTQTTQVVQSILSNVLQTMNMKLSNGHDIVGLAPKSSITQSFNYIDFFVPGMIGFTIMQQAIYGSIERNTKYRKDGILRKLLTTPITHSEWILSKMVFMLFLSFLTTAISIAVGIIAFGLRVNITPLMILTIISTSFLFSGIGMIIGRFVKEEETADMAAGAISFPMMFLAGTFFPLAQMPAFLQTIAQVLPLYYVNEALRNSMIYENQSLALTNAVIVLVFAIIFFIVGIFLTKWREN